MKMNKINMEEMRVMENMKTIVEITNRHKARIMRKINKADSEFIHKKAY